jgi:glycosyltransferase involved in cell wall biosynthesis
MHEKGLKKTAFAYIPNGYCFSEDEFLEKNLQFSSIMAKKDQGKFIIGFSGSHGKPNALMQLINAADQLQIAGNSNIHFYLLGDGTEKQNLIKQSAHLTNITFLDAVEKKYIPEFLSFIYVAFLTRDDVPIYRYGISPNKLFEYMANKKPVLHALPEGVHDLVKQSGAGCSVCAGNIDEISKATIYFSKLSGSELKVLGENGYDFIKKEYDYKILAKKYLQEIL